MGRGAETTVGSRVAVLESRMDNLEQVVVAEKKRLNGNLEKIERWQQSLDKGLSELRLELRTQVLRKPSWGVALAITTLASLVCGLGTYLLTRP